MIQTYNIKNKITDYLEDELSNTKEHKDGWFQFFVGVEQTIQDIDSILHSNPGRSDTGLVLMIEDYIRDIKRDIPKISI